MKIPKRLTSEQRKAQILKKATSLFSRLGYEKTTIGKLAAECKITEPALYRYFSSKKAIYAEVLRALEKKIDTGALAAKVKELDDIEDILFAVAGAIKEAYTKNPEVSRLLLFCSLEGHSLTKRVFDIIRTPYSEILNKALDRLSGENLIEPVDTAITARCFIGMVTECVMGSRLWKKAQGPICDPKRNMNNTIPIFARGLRKK